MVLAGRAAVRGGAAGGLRVVPGLRVRAGGAPAAAQGRPAGGGGLRGGAGRAAAAADAKRAEGVLAKGIHFVFARALRRFQGDLRLWRRYFDFCKAQGGGKALGRALARALRLHPAEPGLWTAAADWEFNGR